MHAKLKLDILVMCCIPVLFPLGFVASRDLGIDFLQRPYWTGVYSPEYEVWCKQY